MGNQKINCTVATCRFNDLNKHHCMLEQIHVSPIDDCETCEPDESMCSSYEFSDD